MVSMPHLLWHANQRLPRAKEHGLGVSGHLGLAGATAVEAMTGRSDEANQLGLECAMTVLAAPRVAEIRYQSGTV
jgi:hypothetical protein